MYVEIGGIEQWIEIAGEYSGNPVLLCLHGGPGGTSRTAAEAWRPWEKHFTVVHWDQRGAGLTLEKNGEDGCGRLTVERMVDDGIALAEHLRSRLKVEKIILVGHSWGSILGVHMIQRRPDLFAAFVGTGQAVNMRRNEELNYAKQLAQAEATHNEPALAALTEIGPPPYTDRSKIGVLRQWADDLATGTGDNPGPRPPVLPTGFSPADFEIMMRGFRFSGAQLYEAISATDLLSLDCRFDVPVFIFMATDDQQTAIELAEEYFDAIMAPYKEFVRFEGCHHFVMFNRPDDFLDRLVDRVLPRVRQFRGAR